MKVAINETAEYGVEFDISGEAIKMLVDMNSPIISKEAIDKYFSDKKHINYLKKSVMGKKKYKMGKYYLCHTFIKDELLDLDNEYVYFYQDEDYKRSHPDLIKVIKTLKEKAAFTTPYAGTKIKIVEIPDNVKYRISKDYGKIGEIIENAETWR